MVSSSASRVWTISGRPVARAAAMWVRKLAACRSRGAEVVEIVEAALADRDHARVGGELDQRCRIVEAFLAGLVRVDADGAEDLGPALGEGDADRPAGALGGDVDHAADAGGLRPLDHAGLVLGEARIVEVAVAVDDHAASGSTWRGKTPAGGGRAVPARRSVAGGPRRCARASGTASRSSSWPRHPA